MNVEKHTFEVKKKFILLNNRTLTSIKLELFKPLPETLEKIESYEINDNSCQTAVLARTPI